MVIKHILKFCFIILLICILIYYLQNNKLEKFNDKLEPTYLFFTGGYDSTFRLCYLLLVEKKVVKPIYIIDPNLDNVETKKVKRRNHIHEVEAINKIKAYLFQNYPFTKKLLLNTLIIKKVNISSYIQKNMEQLHKQKKVRRPVCQYGGMAQVTFDLNKKIEICIENEQGSQMNKTIKNEVICNNINCQNKDRILKNKKDLTEKSLIIFKNFIFSTLHLSKMDMLNISKKNNFSEILKMTWSCWYPKNNKPCNKCVMCRERLKI